MPPVVQLFAHLLAFRASVRIPKVWVMKNDAFLYDALYQALNNGQVDGQHLEQLQPGPLFERDYVKQYAPLVRRLASGSA